MIVQTIHGSKNAFELHQRMADKIATRIREAGCCAPTDLLGTDFSYDDVMDNWEAAYSLAQIDLLWLDAA